MVECLFVGAGGFLGSVFRYLCGLIPLAGSFPLVTLLINLTGSMLIGLVAGVAGPWMPPRLLLFLKTGVCGGFTTFSTFSLETFHLFGEGKPVVAGLYAVLSVLLCLLGVLAGDLIGRAVAA
ncbi:MAG: fluoride efflux transporter CrcB [Oscillospiraceae bacterium]|jgi:CrcB protein